MAARQTRLIVGVVAVLVCGACLVRPVRANPANFAAQTNRVAQSTPPRRIVSLVPSITEELFAIGAGPQVVGVSTFDAFPDAVKTLPRVGALLDPDTERIFSLRPDLVVLYGSQADLQAQFTRAGIRTFTYRHAGIANVLASIRDIAMITGHQAEGDRVVLGVTRQLDDVRARVRGRPRPRTLLVIDRQPNTLREVYASGGVGFLHEMLEIAGGDNVFADVQREAVQPSTETLLAKGPDLILEVRAEPLPPAVLRKELSVWSTLASVPAVRSGRVVMLTGQHLVVPGPRLGHGVEAIAHALHPDAFK